MATRGEAVDGRSGRPRIGCPACGGPVRPDPKSKRRWQCAECGGGVPHLKRHWRLMAVVSGGVPLLAWLIGLIVLAGFAPDALAPAATEWRRVAALFFACNALPFVILISAYLLPRPHEDSVSKALVGIWLAASLFALIALAWQSGRVLLYGLPGCWQAGVLAYYFWLSGKTRRMLGTPDRRHGVGGLLSRVRRPAGARPQAVLSEGLGGPATAIEQKIGGLRKRVRRLVAVYGLSCVAGAVIAAVVLLGLADYGIRLQDRGLRVIFSLALLGVVGWTCYRYLYLALTTHLADVELARPVERRFPALGGGLASAVEFIRQPEDEPTAGSVSLRRAVIAQTTAEIERLDLGRAVEPAPTVRTALSTMWIFLTALSLVVLDPISSRIALARLANPFGGAAWPQAYHLLLLDEVTMVAREQAFEVEVVERDGGRLPPDVRIHYRFENPDGGVVAETELMRFVDGRVAARRENGSLDPRRKNGVMVARREKVTRPFSYRVEGGDDHSMRWIAVEVLEPPALESLNATLVPPDYTGWAPEQAEKHVRALVGTRVEMRADSTKPLQSAVLCLEGGTRLEARVVGARQVEAGFLVERSGAYWFELTDVEGLSGGGGDRWEIRAVPDAPPTVAIEQPAGNVFVTPEAVVPLHVAAKDDLAIHQVDLLFSRSDLPDEEPSALSLYAGPDRVEPQAGGLSGGGESGDNLVLPPYAWQLSELKLQPGMQVTFHARVTDYRPNTGVSEPRRLTIITPEELTERIAARQAAILAELSRVLEMQRKSRAQVGDLEIRSGEVGLLSRLDLDHLRGAELSQRQVDRTLTSPVDGLPMHVLGLLADLENNKVDSPDIQRQMGALLEGIDELKRENLPAIERELTAAIKAVEVRLEAQSSEAAPPDANQPKNVDPAVVDSLASAGRGQDLVIASLERMLDELGQWDRYRRFHSEISQLLRRQEELRETTRELGTRTLTKTMDDLLPEEAADLKIVARRQFELARELDKVQQAMERASDQLLASNPLFAETIGDALYRAKELAISGQMRSCAGQIQVNRMGQAIGRQEQIIEGLREILDILANRRENELERLIKQLRDAEAQLAEAARQEEGLKKAIEQAEQTADEAQRQRQLERLSRQQEQLQEQTERMARRLDRLMAEDASQTVAQAAQKMQQAAQSAGQGNSQGASKQAAGAKRDLDEARRQVAQKRQEAEIQLALEQLARLEQTLGAMRRRQDEMISETQRLDGLALEQGQLTRAQNASLHQLARAQGLLQTETLALSEKLVGAEVFNLALSGAAREMGRAAALLEQRNTGSPTQLAEQNALRRLDQLLEALKPEEPEQDPEGGKGGQGGQGGQGGSGQPPGSGIQTLVELKLLKLLQEEVNRRTQELESAFGRAGALPDHALREYVELSEEQGRLADLLLNLITPQEDPDGSLEDLLDDRPDRLDDVLETPLDEEDRP